MRTSALSGRLFRGRSRRFDPLARRPSELALGARRRTIVVQFLLEASAVSALGGVLGTLVGLGVAKLVAAVTSLSAAVQPLTVLAGVGFSAVVGLVFGIWPAARAAQLDPVEALRHE